MKRQVVRWICVLVIIAVLLGLINLVQPLPEATPEAVALKLPGASAVDMPWPAHGQAAFGTLDDGLLADHKDGRPVSIASIAKVIAALAVLKEKPLNLGQQGPSITLGPEDVADYNYYYLHDGSVARVISGEKISEYQALQAMMLPSANNMADSLTDWAFGSAGAYAAYANQMVKDMGMKSTSVGSASGFDNTTLSTAGDLVILAQAALDNSLLSGIVDQPKAVIPVAGTVQNVNWLLGEDGVVGIKTGNTGKAGGCFLFAAKRIIQGHKVTVIGAVLDDSNLNQSLIDAQALIRAGDNNFRLIKIPAGQTLATYKTAWNTTASAVTKKDINMLAWQNQPAITTPSLRAGRAPLSTGSDVGSLKIRAGKNSATVRVVLESALPKPSILWRLTHF